jgi:hypothetical protein
MTITVIDGRWRWSESWSLSGRSVARAVSSVVWLGLKVYLIVDLGLPLLAMTVAFLCIAIITAVR